MKKEFDLVSFGEIMLRLSPPRHERVVDSDIFEKRAGGAELNVASGVALLGLSTGIISMLPKNKLGTFIKNRVRLNGVSDDLLQYDSSADARLGVYYYEMGAAPRKPTIIYDRKNSSINSISLEDIPQDVFESTKMFHISGITLALSNKSQNLALELISKFKDKGTKISFDVNYRANLWTEEEARETIEQILPLVDVLFISEETCRKMFKRTGNLSDIQREFAKQYDIEIIATTQREVESPRVHHFTSLMYSHKTDKHYTEEPYVDIDIIDRIGSGDAYVAGALFGLLAYDDPELAMRYGNATSALKSTIPGDLPSSDFEEATRIMKEHSNTGEKSEMDR